MAVSRSIGRNFIRNDLTGAENYFCFSKFLSLPTRAFCLISFLQFDKFHFNLYPLTKFLVAIPKNGSDLYYYYDYRDVYSSVHIFVIVKIFERWIRICIIIYVRFIINIMLRIMRSSISLAFFYHFKVFVIGYWRKPFTLTELCRKYDLSCTYDLRNKSWLTFNCNFVRIDINECV